MKGLFIFLGGALVGAAAAALLTPMRGDELRDKIRKILIEKGVIATDEIEEFVERVALELEES